MHEEWNGLKPRKFRTSKKIIEPIPQNTINQLGTIGQATKGIQKLPEKRHFDQTKPQTAKEEKPCFRIIRNPHPSMEKAKQLNKLDTAVQAARPRPESRCVMVLTKHYKNLKSRFSKPSSKVELLSKRANTVSQLSDSHIKTNGFIRSRLGQRKELERLEHMKKVGSPGYKGTINFKIKKSTQSSHEDKLQVQNLLEWEKLKLPQAY